MPDREPTREAAFPVTYIQRPDGRWVARHHREGVIFESDPREDKESALHSCWRNYVGFTQRPHNSEGI